MLFSIITICLNDEKRIQKTLKSVYSQTCIDYEHLIIDGQSYDSSLEEVERARRHYPNSDNLRVYSEKDKGLYDAMNKGVKKASGKYLCFMNCGDAFFDENVLQSVYEYLLRMPGYDVYYGDGIAMQPDGSQAFQFRRFLCQNDDQFRKQIAGGLFGPCHQAQFADRRCFENNMFDLRYQLRAEANWFIKMYMQGGKIKYMPQIVCKYEMGGCSQKYSSYGKSRTEIKQILEEFNLYRDELDEAERKLSVSAGNTGILRKWLALKIAGRSVAVSFLQFNYRNIAIYGYGYMGNYLINDLKHTEITVDYVIDRDDKYEYEGVPVFKPVDKLPKTDVIVVTIMQEYDNIKNMLSKMFFDIPVISIEDVLENAWL